MASTNVLLGKSQPSAMVIFTGLYSPIKLGWLENPLSKNGGFPIKNDVPPSWFVIGYRMIESPSLADSCSH